MFWALGSGLWALFSADARVPPERRSLPRTAPPRIRPSVSSWIVTCRTPSWLMAPSSRGETPGWASRAGTTTWALIATSPLVTDPDVHVVHRGDAGDSEEATARRRRRSNVLRHPVEEDDTALAHQAPGAAEDDHRDEDRDDRVDPHPPGEVDHHRRDERTDRTEDVAENVEVDAAGVEVVAAVAVQDRQRDEVDHQAGNRPRRRTAWR